MADEVGSVKYKVELDNSGLDKDAKKTETSIASKLDAISGKLSKSFGYQVLKDIGGAFISMGQQAVQGFAAITQASVDSRAALEQNVGGVRKLFEDNADAVIKNSEEAYRTAGLSANAYMETVTSFSASLIAGLDGDTKTAVGYADRAIRDMADNANTFGTSMESIQVAYAGFAKGNYTLLDNLKLGFGGTKEEMQRLIATAATYTEEQEKLGVAVDASSLSFSNIIDAISVMQEHMNIAGATAAEASGTIEGSINAAKAAYDDFINGSISGQEFAETAMTAVENIAASVAESVQSFADQLPGIVEAVAGSVPAIAETLGPPLLDALEAIVQSVSSVGSGMIESLVQGAIENAPKMLDAAAAALVSLMDGITANLPGVLDVAMQIVDALATGIARNLPELLVSAVSLIATLATGLVEHIPDLLGTALDIVLGLLKYLIENAPTILQAAPELIGQLIAGLINQLPQVATGVMQIVQKIIDTFLSIDWRAVGTGIIDGIKSGILKAASAVVDAVKDVGGRMVSGVKRFLKIESPSKVFRDEVGAMIPAGMAEGIEEAGPEVEGSMDQLLRNFTADVDLRLPDVSGYAQDLGAQISARSSAQITVPVVLDGREIARATAVYTNEQLAWEAR